jgi:hypothetical protein
MPVEPRRRFVLGIDHQRIESIARLSGSLAVMK